MTNLEKFNDTVSILVKAYLNDTLERDNCYACAVGNIIASKNGYRFRKCNIGGRHFVWDGFDSIYQYADAHPIWTMVFYSNYDHQVRRPSNLKGEVKQQIESTGYTWKQLARVEAAFESIQDNFDGLMAVVDVLADIHKIDLTEKEHAKTLFVR